MPGADWPPPVLPAVSKTSGALPSDGRDSSPWPVSFLGNTRAHTKLKGPFLLSKNLSDVSLVADGLLFLSPSRFLRRLSVVPEDSTAAAASSLIARNRRSLVGQQEIKLDSTPRRICLAHHVKRRNEEERKKGSELLQQFQLQGPFLIDSPEMDSRPFVIP